MIYKCVDTFLIKDFVKDLITRDNEHKIGWVVPYASTYKNVMASTRIRVYDVINYINTHSSGFCSCLYRKHSNYGVVVFQKVFSKKYHDLAVRLKKKGVKVVFDINVNYVSKEITKNSTVTDRQVDNAKLMISLSDGIITSSKYLYNVYKEYHNNVALIEESIPTKLFKCYKEHKDDNIIKLIYCGYAVKAWEIKPIADVLRKKYTKKIELLTVCDQDPRLDFIEYEYVYYDYAKLPEILLRGDICIAPRNLTVEYNFGHAFTKIGYPMSVGLCVLASPVPSYIGSPAVICNNPDEWENNLKDLIMNINMRKSLAKLGREYCMNNYSLEVVGKQYIEFFNKIFLSR